MENYINPALPKIPPGGSLIISQKSIDQLIAFVISSKELYEKKYQQPTWPGGASGVTIGIGYDCGYYCVSAGSYCGRRKLKLFCLQLFNDKL
ncbi:MAG: hypothetical protein C4308_07320 [Chitinophagaceae bacterium]